MLEAKAKDLALLRLREQLAARGVPASTSSRDLAAAWTTGQRRTIVVPASREVSAPARPSGDDRQGGGAAADLP